MAANPKIVSIDQLAAIVADEQRRGRVAVQSNGVFDLVHVGHIRHFESARTHGDLLVITVTADRQVRKGPGRPAFPIEFRLEALAALQCVDFVAENPWPTASDCINHLRPDIYARGPDYLDELRAGIGPDDEASAVREAGGRFVMTDDISFTRASLVTPHLRVPSEETQSYLEAFGQRHPTGEVVDVLDRIKDLKVLTLGETIIDEYQFVEPIGRSAKEPLLATRMLSMEEYAGGILAVANNIASFVNRVDLISALGSDGRREMVARRLAPNVDPDLLEVPGGRTIVKRRYVENYTLSKMFEVYEMDADDPPQGLVDQLVQRLQDRLDEYDLVVVVDFGHGMIQPSVRKVLCKQSRFLALNVQSNAGNHPYHTITQYPCADYLTAAEPELRLEGRQRTGDLRPLLTKVAQDMSASTAVVTRGKYGCLCYERDVGFIEIPSLAPDVVDRMGAGDAFLSVSALAAAVGAPTEVVGFVGSAASAQAVATLGHQQSVDRDQLTRDVKRLMAL